MTLLTIFTPSYNRSHTLSRVYKSFYQADEVYTDDESGSIWQPPDLLWRCPEP